MQLVDRPVIFKCVAFIRQRKFRSIYNVRWLENDGQNKSGEIMHGEDADEYLPPEQRGEEDRYNKDISDVKEFCSDQDQPFAPLSSADHG